MVNGAQITFGKKAVVADPQDIIRSGKKTATKIVDISLRKVAPFEPTPLAPLPPGALEAITIPVRKAADLIEGVKRKQLIVNIETTGFRPWKHRIIAIGYQDPMVPNEPPNVIMFDDEKQIIEALFTVVKEGKYNELVGYGLSFDFRFLFIKAMFYNIDASEFFDMDLFDLMQVAAKVKMAFVYKPQQPPKLSELADYLWNFPKAFSDTDMIKFWASGDLEKVRQFTSEQITRIFLLYLTFRKVTENPFVPSPLGIASEGSSSITNPQSSETSKLTIPEANLPETWTAKCEIDLSEHEVPITQEEFTCPIDGTIIKRPT